MVIERALCQVNFSLSTFFPAAEVRKLFKITCTSSLDMTCKSTTHLAKELQASGHLVSQPTVWRLLDNLGYSMQSNRKTLEGTDHPDRNEQFDFINESVKVFLHEGCPVISVDTKKKELIGPYKMQIV